MHFTKPFKMAFLIPISLTMIIFALSACSVRGFNEPLRKSVVGYNMSDSKISVTSVIGIQTFAKGDGPQNLFFGNLKEDGYASKESRGYLYIEYPIQIKWVNGFLDDPNPDWPTNFEQDIKAIYGVRDSRTELSEAMSLILVYNGTKWDAYYSPNSSLLKKDILSIIESYE